MTSVLVVGGGLSGLTAAWRLLGAGCSVTVLEGRERTGGVIHRGAVPSSRGSDDDAADVDLSPVIDLGAESMLSRRPEAVALAHELGLGDDLEPPAVTRASVYSRGRLHPMPTGHLMGIPARAESAAGLLTRDEVDRLRVGLAAVGTPVAGDVTVGGWLSARLGPAVVDRLVEPLLGGVYAGRVHRLSLQSAIPALWPVAVSGEPIGPAVERLTTTGPGGGPPFTGLRGGVGRLVEALTEAVRDAGAEVLLGTSATGLARTGRGWTVRHGPAWAPESRSADAVLLAVPAPASARLLASARIADLDPAATLLARIELASMALVAVTVRTGTLASVTDGPRSGVLVPSCEGRLVKAMTFSSTKWGWAGRFGTDILRLSVGRAGEEPALQRPDADLAESALAEARDLLGIDLPVLGRRVIRWGGGLPQYAPGHRDLVAGVRTALARVDALEVCGAAFDGVGIPACIAASTAASARLAGRSGGLPE